MTLPFRSLPAHSPLGLSRPCRPAPAGSIHPTDPSRIGICGRLSQSPLPDAISGGELELLAWDSAQLEQPNQSFLDQVIRTRRAGGDSDDGGARRKPEV